MLRNLLAALGIGAATSSSAGAGPPHTPYSSGAANEFYNLLFWDEPGAFRPQPGEDPTRWQTALFSAPADAFAIDALANDTAQEGRIRSLAYALTGGLDVLAAFSEGGVRYINQTGNLAVFEGVATIQELVRSLFKASQPLVAHIGPWNRARMSPPKRGNVRLTFLVSDGLYFGEGPMPAMQREAMAGPIIRQATELLQVVVAAGTK